MIHCCLLCPYTHQQGGAELSFLHLLRYGRGLGVEWTCVFLRPGPMAEECAALGVPTIVLNLPRQLHPLKLPLALVRLRRFLRQHRCQALFAWVEHVAILAGLATVGSQVRPIWLQQGAARPIGQVRGWLIDRPVPAVLANSVPTGAAQHRILPQKPIVIVPPGVDLNSFDPDRLPLVAECRTEAGLPRDELLIAMVGRLQRWKGFHTLLEAMPGVLERFGDARAVLIGGPFATEPGYEAELRALAARLGIAERATFTGAIEHERVPRLMRACDVIVHASHHEPFGIVVIEGMASGKPTIAGNVGGPQQIIEDGVNGLLIPPERPDQLAAALAHILGNKAFAQELAQRGRERAADFSVHAFAQRMTDAVRMAIENAPSPGVYFDGQQISPTELVTYEASSGRA